MEVKADEYTLEMGPTNDHVRQVGFNLVYHIH
jgi:hypothetical protein